MTADGAQKAVGEELSNKTTCCMPVTHLLPGRVWVRIISIHRAEVQGNSFSVWLSTWVENPGTLTPV